MNNLITYSSAMDKFVTLAVLTSTSLVAATGWLLGSYLGSGA